MKPPPAALTREHIFLFANSSGYDGQAYHYVAHDPFLTRGFQTSIDTPRFRYRRIFVPLCAWLLAAGQDRFVDSGYIAVILIAVFCGVWWVAAIAEMRGTRAAWALAFLFVPAVTTSLDRLTVDGVLAAVTAGVVLYSQRQRWTAVLVLCVVAPLVRESGLLLPAGLVAWCVLQRQFRRGLLLALSAIPMLAWAAYVHLRTPAAMVEYLHPIPFEGLIQRLLTPFPYPFPPAINAAATILDYAALLGVAGAVIYAVARARALATQPWGFVAFAFVALTAFVSAPDVWVEAYAFARVISPLMVLVGLDGFCTRSVAAALPLALTAPRIGLQIGSQILNVARGLTGV